MTVAFRLPIVALAWAAASSVQAQVDTIRVGSLSLTSHALKVGADTTETYYLRGDQRLKVMTYIEETSRTPRGYMVVGRNIRPTGQVISIDSILVSDRLLPLWHWDVTPGGEIRVDFSAQRVRGTRTDTAGKITAIDAAFAVGAFDYSIMGMIIERLPYRPGYSAILVTHDIQRGDVLVPVKVVSEEALQFRGKTIPVWKVEVDLGSTKAMRWIDKTTRDVLRTTVSTPNGDMIVERS